MCGVSVFFVVFTLARTSSWRFELEIFPSRLPSGHPYKLFSNVKSNACRTVNQTLTCDLIAFILL